MPRSRRSSVPSAAHVALVTLAALAAGSPAAAQDAAAAPPVESAVPDPVPEFLGDDLIRMPDGTMVFFYRVNYVAPAVLADELKKWLPAGDNGASLTVEPAGTQFAPSPAPPVMSGERARLQGVGAVQNWLRIRTTEDNLPVLRRVLRMIDIPQPQVQIDVKVIELTYDEELRVGMSAAVDRPLSDTFFRAAELSFPNRLDAVNVLSAAFAREKNYLTFEYMLDLAESGGQAKVESQPSVLASQGETALVRAGDNEPIVQQNVTANNVVATTRFEPVGLRLEVQPLLIGRDAIRARVVAEVSRVSEFRTTTTSADLQVVNPVIASRYADTVVTIPDGETLVISGIRQKSDRDVRTGIPGLKDLPVLGWAFGSTTQRRQETELFFWITMTIKQPEEARLVIPPVERARTGQ